MERDRVTDAEVSICAVWYYLYQQAGFPYNDTVSGLDLWVKQKVSNVEQLAIKEKISEAYLEFDKVSPTELGEVDRQLESYIDLWADSIKARVKGDQKTEDSLLEQLDELWQSIDNRGKDLLNNIFKRDANKE